MASRSVNHLRSALAHVEAFMEGLDVRRKVCGECGLSHNVNHGDAKTWNELEGAANRLRKAIERYS